MWTISGLAKAVFWIAVWLSPDAFVRLETWVGTTAVMVNDALWLPAVAVTVMVPVACWESVTVLLVRPFRSVVVLLLPSVAPLEGLTVQVTAWFGIAPPAVLVTDTTRGAANAWPAFAV